MTLRPLYAPQDGNRIAGGIAGFSQAIHPAYCLFQRDRMAEHARSALGVFWDLLEPLVLALTFVALFHHRADTPDLGGISYPAYVVSGVLLWQIFADAVIFGVGAINRFKTLLKTASVSAATLVLTAGFRAGYYALWRILALLLTLVLMGHPPSLLGAAAFLAAWPVLLLLGLAIGLLAAPFNVLSADVGKLVTLSLRPLMFLSGTAFPLTGSLDFLGRWNGVAVLLADLRNLLFHGSLAQPDLDLIVVGLTIAHMALAVYVFRIGCRVLPERY